MPTKRYFLSDPQLITIGRRYGSDDVALEASEAAARWNRDQTSLASYGHGKDALAAFEADRKTHDALRASRPEAVTAKKMSVVLRDQHVSDGWAWVDRVVSMLALPARTDEALDTALGAARPADDAALAAGIQALAQVLSDARTRLGPDAEVDQRLGEVQALCQALQSSPGTVHTSKSQTVADTEQLDLCDGKLYVWMRELNRAARRAVRNGHLSADVHEYVFHHLKRSGNPAPPAPAAPTPPASQ